MLFLIKNALILHKSFQYMNLSFTERDRASKAYEGQIDIQGK